MSNHRLQRHPRLLILAGLLMLGLGGTARAECLNESYAIEVPEAGSKTKLADGQQVVSFAKTSVGLVEIRATVKSGVIAGTNLYLDNKLGQETSYQKLPPEAQKCVKLLSMSPPMNLPSLAPGLSQGWVALLDFLVAPAEAASCKAKVVFRAEHCIHQNGQRICGYATVLESCGKYYVV